MARIVNVTPHPITFQSPDGSVYTIEPCGIVISARPVEEPAGMGPGRVELVRTRFDASVEEYAKLGEVYDEYTVCGGCGIRRYQDWDGHADSCVSGGSDWIRPIVVGSIIAAQAFPGKVFAMIPVPGFERVPVEQKRMLDHKFTTFQED